MRQVGPHRHTAQRLVMHKVRATKITTGKLLIGLMSCRRKVQGKDVMQENICVITD